MLVLREQGAAPQAHWEEQMMERHGILLWLTCSAMLSACMEKGTLPETATMSTQNSSVWDGAAFPVENFLRYTSPFGYRSIPGAPEPEFHRGLDISAPLGSPVRNWWPGTVSKVTLDPVCGVGLTIASGSWEHVYCHLAGEVQGSVFSDKQANVQLKEGDAVAAGKQIGRVGLSGRTTGPHLHWGLKLHGQWVDPAPILQQLLRKK